MRASIRSRLVSKAIAFLRSALLFGRILGRNRHCGRPLWRRFVDSQTISNADRAYALDWLDRAFEERFIWLAYLEVDPVFDSLRQDFRFKQLVTRMRFPHQKKHATL